MSGTTTGLDRGAAVTRSLLGWGVVAGPVYVVVGLVLALATPGFDLGRHALSLLMLGDAGWVQRTNFVVTGIMVLAAAAGMLRCIRDGRGLAIGVLTAVYGACLLLSAAFPPDAGNGFPVGAPATNTTSGLLHLVFGGVGFLALAAAALAYAAWCRAAGAGSPHPARVLGALVIVGFFGGAALSRTSIGVALLWVAVLAGWGWLALACARLYRWTPHPVTGERR